MVGVISGQVGLGCVRKWLQASIRKPKSGNPQVSALVPASNSCLDFPQRSNKPFPPQVALSHTVYHSNSKQIRRAAHGCRFTVPVSHLLQKTICPALGIHSHPLFSFFPLVCLLSSLWICFLEVEMLSWGVGWGGGGASMRKLSNS